MQPPISAQIQVRLSQQRDFYAVQRLLANDAADIPLFSVTSAFHEQTRHKGVPLSQVLLLNWLPHPLSSIYRVYVADCQGEILGLIRVAAFNHSRSTWQIDRLVIAPQVEYLCVGTSLIRHALEACWEARTWLLEVDVQSKDAIALYRQNGFQPLAHLTNWEISKSLVEELAQHSPDLPNLMPVNNADAPLLYQLDTAAMPPQIRQVYDLSISDFSTSLIQKVLNHGQHLLHSTQEISGYVYESQRKAAIAYFSLLIHRNPVQGFERPVMPHHCHMTIHPAYTWLYPEVMSQVAKVISQQAEADCFDFVVSSTDYQPEREAYLEQIQAGRVNHGLLMGRSVWHKVREARLSLDALQLSKMLAGLQPAQRPVPGRIDTFPSTKPEELP